MFAPVMGNLSPEQAQMINLPFTSRMIWDKFFNFSNSVPVLGNWDNGNNDFVVLFWGKVIYVKCLIHG